MSTMMTCRLLLLSVSLVLCAHGREVFERELGPNAIIEDADTLANLGSEPSHRRVKRQFVVLTSPKPDKNITSPSKPVNQATEATTPIPSTTTTPAPSPGSATPNVTSSTTTSTPPPGVQSTPRPSPMIIGTVNISDINKRNYTYIEHTSFDNGMNGWDFEGVWQKIDLNEEGTNQSVIPKPKTRIGLNTVEGGGTTGGAAGSGTNGENSLTGVGGAARTMQKIGQLRQEKQLATTPTPVQPPDNNNFVFISFANRVPGTLEKSFDMLSDGAVFFTYFVNDPNINFTITLENINKTVYTLFDFANNGTSANAWVTQDANFTQDLTLSEKFKLSFNVRAKTRPASDGTDRDVSLALHHIAVGGAELPPKATTTPAPIVIPPGALEDIKKISDSIWIALYVFLFFFLAAIAALVFLIVRGRCRQKATPSTNSDYDPNTSYRLDKVYDNPAYDANATN